VRAVCARRSSPVGACASAISSWHAGMNGPREPDRVGRR
jgi:hypothetical protein